MTFLAFNDKIEAINLNKNRQINDSLRSQNATLKTGRKSIKPDVTLTDLSGN